MTTTQSSYDYMNNYPRQLKKQARELIDIIKSEGDVTYEEVKRKLMSLKGRKEYVSGESKSLIDKAFMELDEMIGEAEV